MFAKDKNVRPYMKSLAACLSKMVGQGYIEKFKATKEGLECEGNHKLYRMDEVNIVSFFRFTGSSDPRNNASLYVIETGDGERGTLVELSHQLNKLSYGSRLNSVWANKSNEH